MLTSGITLMHTLCPRGTALLWTVRGILSLHHQGPVEKDADRYMGGKGRMACLYYYWWKKQSFMYLIKERIYWSLLHNLLTLRHWLRWSVPWLSMPQFNTVCMEQWEWGISRQPIWLRQHQRSKLLGSMNDDFKIIQSYKYIISDIHQHLAQQVLSSPLDSWFGLSSRYPNSPYTVFSRGLSERLSSCRD